jgi:N-acetylglutamate synthase-like GNAT family acetyltransferase
MITDFFNIHIRKVNELDKKERLDINNFILDNFEKSRLNTYDIIIYFTINNNSIIAFVGLYFIHKYLSLNQLCVHINYRNKGLATNLFKIIDNLYFSIPQILYIDKNKDTTNYLFNFYSKNGFKEIDYLKTLNLTYDKEIEYLMIKEIS